MKKIPSKNINTVVIHAGQYPDRLTGAVNVPIYTASTFAQRSPGKHQGFEYARTQNPTRDVYEKCVAELENGAEAVAFGSGMAAISAILELLKPGDHIIAFDDLYGGTYRLLETRKESMGLEVSYVNMCDLSAVRSSIKPNTKMLWAESPSNPLLKILDLPKLAAIAKQNNLLAVMDNTFATPILQRPLNFGFDIVIHSVTKYLNGHSDVVGGIAVANDIGISKRIRFLQNAVGAVPSPFDCYLVLRGIKTLALRMERQCENAMSLAKWLTKQKTVERVIYPGLKTHPQHLLAKRQMQAYGGMITILVNGNLKRTVKFLERCKLFTLAESLGAVESLIEHPATMTHASIPKPVRNKLGITDNLVRLSVGIEDVKDLIVDLEIALHAN